MITAVLAQPKAPLAQPKARAGPARVSGKAVRMYDFLRGTVASLDTSGQLGFDVNGVGYLLRISDITRQQLPLDGSVTTVYCRLNVREDALQLFGFADVAERAAFDLLTSVQGVGPAVALAILSQYPITELRQILVTKDVTALKKVKGVGAKSAERMTLELHDKVERIPVPFETEEASQPRSGSHPSSGIIDEVRQALIALGFTSKDALRALDAVELTQDSNAEQALRAALAFLR